jgi:cell fate regulator YaaT (PSP1 superfamily)
MTMTNADDTQTVNGTIAGVRFFEIGKVYHFSCDHLPDLRVGDFVIVETARGRQLGQVMNQLFPEDADAPRDYKPILRIATPTDMMSQKLWKSRETEALIDCRAKAAELGGLGDTKFIAAQYNFDGTLLTVLFSSEEKLNTTRLRTALQRRFKAKLELRQIGPRDVAKLLGGMGACGIPRCCSTFLTDFSPISIKMAKAQGISLNPTEITGMCGRLRCCLVYEYEQYVEARKQLPRRNKRVGTPHGEGKVIDVHPLRDAVTVLIDETPHIVVREDLIPMEEWEALKAKAEGGCTKHGDGPCDCGERQSSPDATYDDDDVEEEHTHAETFGPITQLDEAAEDEPEDEAHDSRRSRGSGQKRGRGRRGKRPTHHRRHTDKGDAS